jgi:hypothetical protein
MKIQFFKLLTLTVNHTYYRNNCRDFGFVVPTDTTQLLKNGRMLAKELDGRLIVLFEADETGKPLAPLTGKTLRFALVLRNPYFGNITDIGPNPGAALRLYRNADSPTDLSTDSLRLAGSIFSHQLIHPERPATVTLADPSGVLLHKDDITAKDSRSSVSFDLTGEQAGMYAITETYPADTITNGIYVDPELYGCAPFGVVEVTINEDFYTLTPNPLAPELTIQFAARGDTLKYYLVARNNTSASFFDKVAIADAGFAEEKRPQVLFDRISAASFGSGEIPPALLGEAPGNVLLFRSQGEVLRQETARKKIQLTKNGDVLIKDLPQPAADRINGDIIIQISN